MIGALLLASLAVAGVALANRLREASEAGPEVSTCALCGRRGLRQQWLAWHHEATHGQEVES